MKCVILAGGRGSRLSEETELRPKPMVEVGGRPILWHIMKIYASHGVNDFIVCLGYKGYVIKEYFANYILHNSDVTFDFSSGEINFVENRSEPWKVTLVDTGLDTMTGGRLGAVRAYLQNEQDFCLTYGDGVADVDVASEIAFHRARNRIATLTVTQPPGRFGATALDGDRIVAFHEKPTSGGGYINGGFMVLTPGIFDYIDGPQTSLETTPLERLVAAGQLNAWRHDGFWHPMDTIRDREVLENHWASGTAPWKVW